MGGTERSQGAVSALVVVGVGGRVVLLHHPHGAAAGRSAEHTHEWQIHAPVTAACVVGGLTLPRRVLTLPRCMLTPPRCVLILPRRVLTLLRCMLTLPRRVLTLPRRVLTLPRCMLTLPRCMSTLPRCVNPTQVYVNPTQVCVNPTQACVNPTQVCVNPTPVCVNPTQVYVNPTPVYVNPTQVYVNPTQVYVNSTQVGDRWLVYVGGGVAYRAPLFEEAAEAGGGAYSDEKVANRDVRDSGGRSLTGPLRDARRFPSARWYPVPGATRTPLGFGICPSFKDHFLSPRAKP
jgi:hypothetical protein